MMNLKLSAFITLAIFALTVLSAQQDPKEDQTSSIIDECIARNCKDLTDDLSMVRCIENCIVSHWSARRCIRSEEYYTSYLAWHVFGSYVVIDLVIKSLSVICLI